MRLVGTFLLFFFCTIGLFAQKESLTLQGKIINQSEGIPLAGVNVFLPDHPDIGTTSDADGLFSLQVDRLPIVIAFSYIGYQNQQFLVTQEKNQNLLITLRSSTENLPEIVVSAQRKIDTLFHQPLNVVDYAFFDPYIVLLVYRNSFDKYELTVIDERDSIVAQLSLTNYDPISLLTDCQDRVFLRTEFELHELAVRSDEISFARTIKDRGIKKFIEECQLSTPNYIFFYTYYYQNQAIQYQANPKTDLKQRYHFPIIAHEHNIDMLIEETGNMMPRSGDVWDTAVTAQLAYLRTRSYFLEDWPAILYQSIYVPIAYHDSMICLFNHYGSSLDFFTENGIALHQIPISYHKNKKWRKQIYYDKIQGRVYTLFDTRWGIEIRPINLSDGSLGTGIPFERDFLKKVKVRNGHLYFLHRNPFRGSRTYSLQKMRIN